MKRTICACIMVALLFLTQVQLGHGQVKETSQDKSKQNEKTEITMDAKNPSVKQPILDIVLVLDNSGSMKENDPQFLTREVVTNFINGLGDESRLGMVIFDQDAMLAEELIGVSDSEAKTKFLKSLDQVNYKGQFTNSPVGIERAIYELKSRGREDAHKVIIFLTDGIVDTGDKIQDQKKETWLKEDLAPEGKKAGIRIFGIAFTDNADFSLIQSLAFNTDGEYFRAYKAEDIESVFFKINQILAKPLEPKIAKVLVQAPAQQLVPTPVTKKQIVEKKSFPLALVIAGAVVFLGVIALFIVIKGKSKSPAPVEAVAQTSGSSPAEPLMPQAELIDAKGVISEESLVLGKRIIEIGRESHNDIIIPKETVSSNHATIEFKDGFFYLEDQRSSNGTSLNYRKIEPNKPVRLKSGDKIKFDIYEFKFILPHQVPAGGTVFGKPGDTPQESGTVIRPSKPSEESALKDSASPLVIEEEEKQKPELEFGPTDLEEPPKDRPTELKPAPMCPSHPARKATELCSACKKPFCKQCITEIDGKDICRNCAK